MRLFQTTRAIAFALAGLLALAACGGDSGQQATGDGGDAGTDTGGTEAGDWEPEWVDDVLQPLPDGFPEREMTIMVADAPESADGILMRTLVEHASTLSPVPIRAEAREEFDAGWGSWEALRYARDTEGGDEGYLQFVFGTPGGLADLVTADVAGDIGVGIDDMTEIITLEDKPYLLIQCNDVPWGEPDFEALMQYIEDNPGELRYMGGGPGAGTDMGFAYYVHSRDVGNLYDPESINHRNVGNTTERATAVAACEGHVTNTTYEAASPHIQAERVDVVLVGQDQRLDEFPDVPTAEEMGITGDPFSSTKQVAVPSTVPDLHLRWLHELYKAAADKAEYQEARLANPGTVFRLRDPEESAQLNDESLAILDELTRELGIHREQVEQ